MDRQGSLDSQMTESPQRAGTGRSLRGALVLVLFLNLAIVPHRVMPAVARAGSTSGNAVRISPAAAQTQAAGEARTPAQDAAGSPADRRQTDCAARSRDRGDRPPALSH